METAYNRVEGNSKRLLLLASSSLFGSYHHCFAKRFGESIIL